jgi:hypothetical protein
MSKTAPAHVDVGPYRYTIVVDELTIRRAENEERARLHGRTEHSRLTIELDPSLPAVKEREVLLHEILHTVAEMVGVRSDLGFNREESVIMRMAPALLDVLRRNPDVVAYLTGGPQ